MNLSRPRASTFLKENGHLILVVVLSMATLVIAMVRPDGTGMSWISSTTLVILRGGMSRILLCPP